MAMTLGVGGCQTAELERMRQENDRKRARLAELRQTLSTLEDDLVRQKALLRVQDKRLARAYSEHRITVEERQAIERDLAEHRSTVASLEAEIEAKLREARALEAKTEENQRDVERKRELAGEIAHLRAQIDALKTAISLRAESAAKKYQQEPGEPEGE